MADGKIAGLDKAIVYGILVFLAGAIIFGGIDHAIMGGKYDEGVNAGKLLGAKGMYSPEAVGNINSSWEKDVKAAWDANGINYTARKIAEGNASSLMGQIKSSGNKTGSPADNSLFGTSTTSSGIGIPSEFGIDTAKDISYHTPFVYDEIKGGINTQGQAVFTVWTYDQLQTAINKAIWVSGVKDTELRSNAKDRYDFLEQEAYNGHELRVYDNQNNTVRYAYMDTQSPSEWKWSDPVNENALSAGFSVTA